MTINWEGGLFLLALFSALGAVQIFVTKAVVRSEMTRGNGYRKVRDCQEQMSATYTRLADLEHEVFHSDGYVRSRFHEIAEALGIRLIRRELKARGVSSGE